MRTTIDIAEPLLRSAIRQATERRTTLSAMVEDAIRVALAAKPASAVGPFRLLTVKGAPRTGIDLDRTSALVQMDDEEQYNVSGKVRRPVRSRAKTADTPRLPTA